MGITARQLEQLQTRLRTGRRTPSPVETRDVATAAAEASVILGIDPSLRGTGWGVLRVDRRGLTFLGCGTLGVNRALPRSRCLVRIAQGLREAIAAHHPKVCAIEALFHAQNLQTALVMGEARGVCLLAAAEAGLDVHEIAPRRVKLAVVGHGGARKEAVARMVQRILKMDHTPEPDAADALAIAMAHAQSVSRYSLDPPRRI